jgi:hypothetical protein
MSGTCGNGRRRDPAKAKPLVEDCPLFVDAVALFRAGALDAEGAGIVRIGPHAASYRVSHVPSPAIDLAFVVTINGATRRVRQRVVLEPARASLGCRPWWFRCPVCGTTKLRLYLPHGREHLACRWCHGLTYRSVQTHDDRVCKLRRDPQRVMDILRGEVAVSETEMMLAIKAVGRGGSLPCFYNPSLTQRT